MINHHTDFTYQVFNPREQRPSGEVDIQSGNQEIPHHWFLS
jgi:hypothetical protein